MTEPSKQQSLWQRISALIKYFVTFVISSKHATELRLEKNCVNNTSIDFESPSDTHYNKFQSSVTTAPINISVRKRFYSVVKSYLAVIISNKHATDPSFNKDSVDCESHRTLPSFSRGIYDQVFITDSDEMYQWASKDTLMFRLFKCLERFSVFRFFLCGLISINPCWQFVLWTDEIINKSEPVEITDTLILHCNSIETYSKVIPRIRGSYDRLILHGHLSWDQVKQLVHPGVKQVRINAKCDIKPIDYDDFLSFIKAHCRGMAYKFSIASETIPRDLLQKVSSVFNNQERYFVLPLKRGYDIIHGTPFTIYVLLCYFVMFAPYFLFFI